MIRIETKAGHGAGKPTAKVVSPPLHPSNIIFLFAMFCILYRLKKWLMFMPLLPGILMPRGTRTLFITLL